MKKTRKLFEKGHLDLPNKIINLTKDHGVELSERLLYYNILELSSSLLKEDNQRTLVASAKPSSLLFKWLTKLAQAMLMISFFATVIKLISFLASIIKLVSMSKAILGSVNSVRNFKNTLLCYSNRSLAWITSVDWLAYSVKYFYWLVRKSTSQSPHQHC